jgi:hemin uptake protein HemP
MIMTESTSQDHDSESADREPVPPADPTRVIRSEEIFAGERVVMIQHADERYRLLITRNDRLILQK